MTDLSDAVKQAANQGKWWANYEQLAARQHRALLRVLGARLPRLGHLRLP